MQPAAAASREPFTTETRNSVYQLTTLPMMAMDMYQAPLFRMALVDAAQDPQVEHIVMDLENLDFMDATGLGVCVGALKRVRLHDKTLTIDIGDNQRLLKIFKITGLTKEFHLIFNDLPAEAP